MGGGSTDSSAQGQGHGGSSTDCPQHKDRARIFIASIDWRAVQPAAGTGSRDVAAPHTPVPVGRWGLQREWPGRELPHWSSCPSNPEL